MLGQAWSSDSSTSIVKKLAQRITGRGDQTKTTRTQRLLRIQSALFVDESQRSVELSVSETRPRSLDDISPGIESNIKLFCPDSAVLPNELTEDAFDFLCVENVNALSAPHLAVLLGLAERSFLYVKTDYAGKSLNELVDKDNTSPFDMPTAQSQGSAPHSPQRLSPVPMRADLSSFLRKPSNDKAKLAACLSLCHWHYVDSGPEEQHLEEFRAIANRLKHLRKKLSFMNENYRFWFRGYNAQIGQLKQFLNLSLPLQFFDRLGLRIEPVDQIGGREFDVVCLSLGLLPTTSLTQLRTLDQVNVLLKLVSRARYATHVYFGDKIENLPPTHNLRSLFAAAVPHDETQSLSGNEIEQVSTLEWTLGGKVYGRSCDLSLRREQMFGSMLDRLAVFRGLVEDLAGIRKAAHTHHLFVGSRPKKTYQPTNGRRSLPICLLDIVLRTSLTMFQIRP